jgi:NADPH:quinone reductase-like Zn-dependent oxidoreductase
VSPHRFDAVVLREYGAPEVLKLEHFEREWPSPGNALVRILATTVNNVDVQLRSGRLGTHRTLPHAPGPDMVGEVLESPDPSWVGKRVIVNPSSGCGRCHWCAAGARNRCKSFQIIGEGAIWGGYSSLVDCAVANLIEVPASLPTEIAACLPVTFGTAWRMLVGQAQVTPNDRVLVFGAGGGIAVAARRIARLLGAEVHVAARPSNKLDRVAAEGFTVWPVNLEELGGLPKKLRAAGDITVVVDAAGGDWFSTGLRILAPGGRLVTCGATTNPMANIDVRHIFWKQTSAMGATGGTSGELIHVLALAARGVLVPEIDRCLPIREAVAAHKAIEEGDVFGKIVLTWS